MHEIILSAKNVPWNVMEIKKVPQAGLPLGAAELLPQLRLLRLGGRGVGGTGYRSAQPSIFIVALNGHPSTCWPSRKVRI